MEIETQKTNTSNDSFPTQARLPECIIDKKVERDRRLYLIKWINLPESQATWEPVESLLKNLDLIVAYEIDGLKSDSESGKSPFLNEKRHAEKTFLKEDVIKKKVKIEEIPEAIKISDDEDQKKLPETPKMDAVQKDPITSERPMNELIDPQMMKISDTVENGIVIRGRGRPRKFPATERPSIYGLKKENKEFDALKIKTETRRPEDEGKTSEKRGRGRPRIYEKVEKTPGKRGRPRKNPEQSSQSKNEENIKMHEEKILNNIIEGKKIFKVQRKEKLSVEKQSEDSFGDKKINFEDFSTETQNIKEETKINYEEYLLSENSTSLKELRPQARKSCFINTTFQKTSLSSSNKAEEVASQSPISSRENNTDESSVVSFQTPNSVLEFFKETKARKTCLPNARRLLSTQMQKSGKENEVQNTSINSSVAIHQNNKLEQREKIKKFRETFAEKSNTDEKNKQKESTEDSSRNSDSITDSTEKVSLKIRGSFEEKDKPKSIKSLRFSVALGFEFLIEWNVRANGEAPEPTFITKDKLKAKDPLFLVRFYESLVRKSLSGKDLNQLSFEKSTEEFIKGTSGIITDFSDRKPKEIMDVRFINEKTWQFRVKWHKNGKGQPQDSIVTNGTFKQNDLEFLLNYYERKSKLQPGTKELLAIDLEEKFMSFEEENVYF